MTLDRKQIKREALNINKNAHVSAYGFTLLYIVIAFALVLPYVWIGISSELAEMDIQTSFIVSPPPAIIYFIYLVTLLLSYILYAGYTLYILGIRRGEHMGCGTLFDGFAFAGKVILLEFVIALKTFLWMLLLYIPGIIASYRYSFALYNLCENPDIGVMEAINLSKEQTKGYKGQLFVLDLSFIGWGLLSGLTMGLLNIWLMPYMEQSRIGYFQKIKEIKQIGYLPPSEDDGQFHVDERSDTPNNHKPYDPEL